MLNPTPRVDCSRGAPMGRFTGNPDPDAEGPFTLQHVPLDSGGYDKGGAYWGLGARLYYFASADGAAEGFFRLDYDKRAWIAKHESWWRGPNGKGDLNRSTAKAQVRDICPNAAFYR